ncbi:hypothetical protein U1Q18_016501 [Sarracenia purpurea var. burkii]
MADAQLIADYCDSRTSSSHLVTDCVNILGKIESQAQNGDALSGLQNQDCCCDDVDEDSADSVLRIPGSRLVREGFKKINLTENIVKFVNAGGGAINEVGDSAVVIMPDSSFEGGDILRTDEGISDAGDYAPLYQSARFGNFGYRFDNLPTGDYLIDLHFVEIINTNGPKGIRVVSELDIYSIVGANKPLMLMDVRVTVGEDGVIVIRFEGVDGNPVISGICIKGAPKILGIFSLYHVKQGGLVCNNCAAQIGITSSQNKHIRMRSIVKYEKKIEELSTQCQLKTNECHEAWMSLASANEELQKVKMALDNKSFENHCLDRAKVMQAAQLGDVSSRYEHEKRFWEAAIDELKRNIKTMKKEHSQLSREAHQCTDLIPELNKMARAVQALAFTTLLQAPIYKLLVSAIANTLPLKIRPTIKLLLFSLPPEYISGNIRVFCRCRPLSKEEVSAGYATVVDLNAAKDGDLGILTSGFTKKLYKFDRVYTPNDDQGITAITQTDFLCLTPC